MRLARSRTAPADTTATSPVPGLRVAVVHDYLTQRGGAERVVLSLMAAFPGARLITSVYDPEKTFPEFADFVVETTWLDRVPLFRADPRRAMPLLPTVFSGVQLDDVDVVICSSSGWAHGVRSDAPKIVYCHNPARWLYQRHQYVEEHGTLVRFVVKAMSPYLKWWDRRAAASVTTYLANSKAVAFRIQREYGIDAQVLPPAITIDPEAAREPVPGVEPGFLLTVSRARSYKNTDVVCQAVASLPDERLVVVGGLPTPPDGADRWPARLQGVSGVSDAQLRWLYANCSAVVGASHEDFGLTPLEGNTFGRPAVVLRAGGYLDTLVEGRTGCFIEELSPEAVREALVEVRELGLDNREIVAHAESFGFEAFRATLLKEAELAIAARGLDPYPPGERPLPQPHDNVAPVRRSVAVMALVAVLVAVLSGAAARMAHAPWDEVAAVACAVAAGAAAVLTALRVRLGRRPGRGTAAQRERRAG